MACIPIKPCTGKVANKGSRFCTQIGSSRCPTIIYCTSLYDIVKYSHISVSIFAVYIVCNYLTRNKNRDKIDVVAQTSTR